MRLSTGIFGTSSWLSGGTRTDTRGKDVSERPPAHVILRGPWKAPATSETSTATGPFHGVQWAGK